MIWYLIKTKSAEDGTDRQIEINEQTITPEVEAPGRMPTMGIHQLAEMKGRERTVVGAVVEMIMKIAIGDGSNQTPNFCLRLHDIMLDSGT